MWQNKKDRSQHKLNLLQARLPVYLTNLYFPMLQTRELKNKQTLPKQISLTITAYSFSFVEERLLQMQPPASAQGTTFLYSRTTRDHKRNWKHWLGCCRLNAHLKPGFHMILRVCDRPASGCRYKETFVLGICGGVRHMVGAIGKVESSST